MPDGDAAAARGGPLSAFAQQPLDAEAAPVPDTRQKLPPQRPARRTRRAAAGTNGRSTVKP